MTAVSTQYQSPNFGSAVVPVEFVILHYTATDLAGTMKIFADPERGVAAHFVIDRDGTIYDLGGFWTNPIRRGAHAGESRAQRGPETVTTLNDRSIGIEIVNFNGNLMEYTDAQYEALTKVLAHLAKRFPSIVEPGRILGHEHVAGFRGKCDPGLRFDWRRVLGSIGVPVEEVHAHHACTAEDVGFLGAACAAEPKPDPLFWENLSSRLEARVRSRTMGDQ